MVQQENMAQLPSWKHSEMTHTAGMLQWMPINSSEGRGKEGEAVG